MLLVFSGCGYKLGYVKPASYQHVRSLYIPTFKNNTLEPRSSVLVTNAVIQQFQRDGSYRISTADRADAVLEASIVDLKRRQARSARFNTLRTSELEFTLVVDYQFRSLRTNEILDEGTIEGETSRFLDPNFQLSERQALPIAAERLAENMVSRLSEGW
ncbi:MAG: LPS assembly lipoprotein LptE [Verrucomicrobiales bacterium]